MQRFEYEITTHPADTFNELVFYCTQPGECSLDQIPHDQTKNVQGLLNERGWQGWELVQLSFGKDGVIAFWKRALEEQRV